VRQPGRGLAHAGVDGQLIGQIGQARYPPRWAAGREHEPELAQQLGRAPGDGELAAALKVTEDDIREARQASLAFTASSLDAPLSDREDATLLADVLGEDDHAIEHAIDMDAVQAHLDELPEREQGLDADLSSI
jgi:DNA-directed RNA polymerase specialized sigma subunit